MDDRSLKYKWDNKNVLDYARKEGFEEGFKIGFEKGFEKGWHGKALTIARDFKTQGFSVDFISRVNKLSIEEVEKL